MSISHYAESHQNTDASNTEKNSLRARKAVIYTYKSPEHQEKGCKNQKLSEKIPFKAHKTTSIDYIHQLVLMIWITAEP